jgi:hypothetical protein
VADYVEELAVVNETRRLGRTARTTSNVKNSGALIAAKERRLAARNHVFNELYVDYQKRMDALLTEQDRKSVTALSDQYRLAFDRRLAETIGHVDQMKAARHELLGRFDETLRREVRAYSEIKALQREYADALRSAGDEGGRRASTMAVHQGDWSPEFEPIREFPPPYDLFHRSSSSDQFGFDTFFDFSDSSAADPTLGFVNNDVQLIDHNRWHDNLSTRGNTSVGDCDVDVGINYTAPTPGALNVAVTMRNLYNRVHVDAWNMFGFSSLEIFVTHWAHIEVLRDDSPAIQDDSPIEVASRVILDDGWEDPGGDDVNGAIPVAPAGPVTLVAMLDGPPLRAGEHVQILGGCSTAIQALVSNMDVTVPVTFWWQVEKLQVWLTD